MELTPEQRQHWLQRLEDLEKALHVARVALGMEEPDE